MKLRLTLENATDLPATSTTGIDFGEREILGIGRSPGLDWTLPDPARLLSGRHCEIRRSADAYLLYDLSTNGTFLAGSTTRLASPHALQDGERLLIGDYILRVELQGDPEPAPADDRTRIARPQAQPLLQLTIRNRPPLAHQPPLAASLGSQGVLRIGRDEDADWTLPDRTGGISREHCTIRFADGAFLLHDTSSNGTFVNDSGERISGIHRLRNGDCLLIGAYLIAAQVSGVADDEPPAAVNEPTDRPTSSAAPGEAFPPRPARPAGAGRRGGDPAAMLADLPATPSPAGGDDRSPARLAGSDDGVTRLARVAQALPPPSPAATPAANAPAPDQRSGDIPDAKALAVDRVLAGIARGLGLSPEDLDEADAAVLGERVGELIRLVTDEIRQLQALQEAARERPIGDAGGASNPLTLMPTSEEALRMLFGPPRRAFFDSRESFTRIFAEFRRHFGQTDAAIRAATQALANELSPEAIEQSVAAESRIGQLLGSRKARLWEIYVERWKGRPALQADRPVSSFVRAFAGPTARNDEGDGA